MVAKKRDQSKHKLNFSQHFIFKEVGVTDYSVDILAVFFQVMILILFRLNVRLSFDDW